MSETTGIVLRTAGDLDELQVVKLGTTEEVEAYLFNKLMPSDFTKNLKVLPCEDGYMYSVEIMESGEWHPYKFILLFHSTRS